MLASLALGLVNSWLNREQMTAAAADAGMGGGFVAAVQAITIVVTLLLIWFIARKGSPVAKWIYVVLTGLSLAAGLAGISKVMELGAPAMVITIAQYLMSAYTLWLLFRPDAKAWFNDGRGTGA